MFKSNVGGRQDEAGKMVSGERSLKWKASLRIWKLIFHSFDFCPPTYRLGQTRVVKQAVAQMEGRVALPALRLDIWKPMKERIALPVLRLNILKPKKERTAQLPERWPACTCLCNHPNLHRYDVFAEWAVCLLYWATAAKCFYTSRLKA